MFRGGSSSIPLLGRVMACHGHVPRFTRCRFHCSLARNGSVHPTRSMLGNGSRTVPCRLQMMEFSNPVGSAFLQLFSGAGSCERELWQLWICSDSPNPLNEEQWELLRVSQPHEKWMKAEERSKNAESVFWPVETFMLSLQDRTIPIVTKSPRVIYLSTLMYSLPCFVQWQ